MRSTAEGWRDDTIKVRQCLLIPNTGLCEITKGAVLLANTGLNGTGGGAQGLTNPAHWGDVANVHLNTQRDNPIMFKRIKAHTKTVELYTSCMQCSNH